MSLIPLGPALRAIATAAALLSGAAHANLVTNGGFEAGTLSSWTGHGNEYGSGVSGGAHSGSYSGSFGQFYDPINDQYYASGGVFQSLATMPGASYDVEFWLRSSSAFNTLFSFEWDGDTQASVVGTPIVDYQLFKFTLVADSSSTDLRFTFLNPLGFFYLDDVSVTQQVAEPLPEPATLALVGVAALVAAARRRGQRVDAA
jgi:flagellin